jgi:hypothetical protein
MLFYIVIITIAWLTYRHFAKKKRAADMRNWGVDYRRSDIRPVTRRLPWKELS